MYMEITPSQNIKLINIVTVGLWTNIWLSYIISIFTNHIPYPFTDDEFFWPMISDTWVTLTGELLSRVFIPPFIYLWSLFCWNICNWLDDISWKINDYNDNFRCLNKYINCIVRVCVQLGLLGFLTCIAINEHDDDRLHSMSALIFFTTQNIFFYSIIAHLYFSTIQMYHKKSIILKSFLSILFTILLIVTGILGNYNNWKLYCVKIALLEWSSVFIITLFHLTLKWDLTIPNDTPDYYFLLEDNELLDI